MQSSRNNPALGGGDNALGMVTWNLGKDWDLPALIEACARPTSMEWNPI